MEIGDFPPGAPLVKYSQFGVSPVNHSESDSDLEACKVLLKMNYQKSGADPGFLKRWFKCRKGGFICLLSHKIS